MQVDIGEDCCATVSVADVHAGSGTVVLTDSTIKGNTASQFGAAFYNQSNTASVLTHCLITGNTGESAIDNLGTAMQITNCTIWANQPNGVFGLVDTYNSIAWGNGTGTESSQVQVLPGSDVLFSYIEGCDEYCFVEPSNIGADPAFADRNGPDTIPDN